MSLGIILSLCDHSGAWSRPFIDKGYKVVRADPKHSSGWREAYGQRGLSNTQLGDGTWTKMEDGGYGLSMSTLYLKTVLDNHPGYFRERVVGILMAPPCTDFSGSGARHWAAKDEDGRTKVSIAIVEQCLAIKDHLKPDWWVLENPAGRIARLVPAVGQRQMSFHPSDYAGWADDPATDAYTKRTVLYGQFNTGLVKRPVEPVMYTMANGKRGSWMFAKLGGKSERTKELRSIAPTGFARAFAAAQCH